MKAGSRAVGVAESYRGHSRAEAEPGAADRSTLAAAVVRADRVVDGFAFGTCTVGGTDATDAVADLVVEMDRDDVQVLMVSGIAPAWYNLVDLRAVHAATDRPVVSVSFEASGGLEPALREAFSGETLARRLETYRDQPDRVRHAVNDEAVFVRSIGLDPGETRDVVRAFTPEGGRPEPLRVARLAARAADRFRANS